MVKGQTQDPPGIPGQYFLNCALCLAKPTPACFLQWFWTASFRAKGPQKQSKGTPSIQIDWFWNQICPIFVLKVCNYIFEKYICQYFWVTSGRVRGRFYPIFVLESITTKCSAHHSNVEICLFEPFGWHLEGDAVDSTKYLCRSLLLQNAVRITKTIQQM